MFANIRNKINHIRDDLTKLDNHPISKTILIVVLFLDLFILNSIFSGLDDHTRQLSTPYDTIPQHCRDIIIDQDWSQDDRLQRLASVVSSYQRSYYYIEDKTAISNEYGLCQPISTLIKSIKNDTELANKLSSYQQNRNQSQRVKVELERSQGAYDTSLLEKIAEENTATTDAITHKTVESKNRLNQLVEQETLLRNQLLENNAIKQLFVTMETISPSDRAELLSDLRRLNFWYPVKRLAMEMAFLIPLIVVFYFWYSWSVSRSKPYQTLVSTHLLVVAFIPVIAKIMELVYEILPQKLLKNLFELLESFKLVAVWYYLLMVLGVLATLALIYFLQKKLFSHQSLMTKRISKGLCQQCGIRLAEHAKVCHGCGYHQFKQCSHCNHATYADAEFCTECGQRPQ